MKILNQSRFSRGFKSFTAKFVKGKARGRLLGYPTLNFDVRRVPSDIVFGVYDCKTFIGGKWYDGASYYGPNITFGETNPVFEIHLLQYHREVSKARGGFVRLGRKIRDIKKFENEETLKKQIAEDVMIAKAL